MRPAKQCIVCDTQLKEKDVIELKREGSFISVIYPHSPSLSTFFFFIRLFPLYLLVLIFMWGFAALIWAPILFVWIHASYGGLTTSYVWIHGSYVLVDRSRVWIPDLLCGLAALMCESVPFMCGLTSLMFGFTTTDVWIDNSFVWAHGSHVWIDDSCVDSRLLCGLTAPMGGSMTLMCEFTILVCGLTPPCMAPRLLCVG